MTVDSRCDTVATVTRQFCTFRIDSHLYGVDILDVKEINPVVEPIHIHHAPPEVIGFINIRGQIYLLLDLRLLLGFEPSTTDGASKVILFKSTVGEHFGILVDAIEDILSVNEDEIESQHKEEHKFSDDIRNKTGYLREGVCKLDKELLVLIKAKRLLPIIDQIMNVQREKLR